MSDLRLWGDITNQKFCARDGGAVDLPTLGYGDRLQCQLVTYDRGDGTLRRRDLNLRAVRARLGPLDEPSVKGQWGVKVEDPENPGTWLATAALNFNATDAQVKAAFDTAFGSLGWTATVEIPLDLKGAAVPSCWLVTIAGAEEHPIAFEHAINSLRPRSFIRRRRAQVGDVWIYEFRLVQSAWARTGVWERVLPAAPSVTELREGGAPDPSYPAINEIQALKIPRDFVGTYVLKFENRETRVLGSDEGATQLRIALNQMWPDGKARFEVGVTTDGQADIEFIGPLGNQAWDELEVEVKSFAAGIPTFALNLKTNEAAAALRALPPGVKEMETWFEVEVQFVGDDEDPEDEDIESRVLSFRQKIKLSAEGIYEEEETIADLPFLYPPEPTNYVPYFAGNVFSGVANYTVVIGDGAATEFTIAHNLATAHLAAVFVRENGGDNRVLGQQTEYTAELLSNNAVKLYFATAPAINGVAVTILTSAPTQQFVGAITVNQSQVNGLEDRLDSIEDRLDAIEGDPGSTGGTPIDSIDLEGAQIDIALRDRFEVLFASRSRDFEHQKVVEGDFTLLPRRAAALLRAVHDNAATVIDTLPLAAASGVAGQLFLNDTGGDVLLAGARGAWSEKVPDGSYFASDGTMYFRVENDTSPSATTSWFPQRFEREFFREFINDRQLRAASDLECAFTLKLGTQAANTEVKAMVVIEVGTLTKKTTPSTTGENIEYVTWGAQPLLEHQVTLTNSLRTFRYGCLITRNEAGNFSAKKVIEGHAENTAVVPAAANFLIRARLLGLDVLDDVPDPRGFILTAFTGGRILI